jgi:hypothetical protein
MDKGRAAREKTGPIPSTGFHHLEVIVRRTISVRIDPNLKAELDGISQTDGVSRSYLAKQAMREYLARLRERGLRDDIPSLTDVPDLDKDARRPLRRGEEDMEGV